MTGDPAPLTHVVSVIAEDDAWAARLPGLPVLVERMAAAALSHACPDLHTGDLGDGAIGVLLTDNAALRVLNRTWRGIDRPTNVLSFPATETRAGAVPQAEFAGVPLMLGDLALAYGTVAREAESAAKPFEQHCAHLIVHGVLHLLGYDHEAEHDATIMEALETRILGEFGIPDPYGTDAAREPSDGPPTP